MDGGYGGVFSGVGRLGRVISGWLWWRLWRGELKFDQSQADFDGLFDAAHFGWVHFAEALYEVLAVDGADLVEPDGGGYLKAGSVGIYDDFVGKWRRVYAACDCRHDGCLTVTIGDIVLDDQSGASLFDPVA